MLAPICLFTYNRLSETKQTVAALQQNYLATESELFIFSDGPKNEEDKLKVNEVLNYIKQISGFKDITIIESPINKGLANSIIDGVTQIIEKYGKVIVLEDDLITSPNFLDFMNQALDFYLEKKKIQSINGFSLDINSDSDVYFHQRTFPWGWATWENRWDKNIFDKKLIIREINENTSILHRFKKSCGSDIVKMLNASLEGRNNSWYVRWVFNHFTNGTYSVFPSLSKVSNVGFNNRGIHCNHINVYKSNFDLTNKRIFLLNEYKKLDMESNALFLKYFTKSYKIWYRLKILKNQDGRRIVKNEIISRLIT
jgi:hypothetical protein